MTTPSRTAFGRFQLVQRLGDGGMATVYLARDGARYVALKVLEGQHAHRPDLRSMFCDEARVTARLTHPNIAAVFGAEPVGDELALSMEYVHGVDLAKVLHTCCERGDLPSYESAITIVMQAAAALDHAHRSCDEQGRPLALVHRDVSLSNIMVRHAGTVKVVDFGIARTTMASVHTNPGTVRGKASYMAPEQCKGKEIDLRADVFGLGVVLYELTTGVRCFDGATDWDRMLSVCRGTYMAPSKIDPDFPPLLERIIEIALAPDPAHRFASCAALANALRHVLAHHGWRGGSDAIRRMMLALFGDVPDPSAVAPSVEVHIGADTTAMAEVDQRIGRRFARGSQTTFASDDEPTLGRPAVRPREQVA